MAGVTEDTHCTSTIPAAKDFFSFSAENSTELSVCNTPRNPGNFMKICKISWKFSGQVRVLVG